MSKAVKHTVAKDGLSISLRWLDFRKKHNITWVKKTTKLGKTAYIPTWPENIVEFNRLNGVVYRLVGNGKFADTPDGRTVEMKDIIFSFPSKDITALFKLSYL